jgi:serine/threonine protein kinase
MSDEKPTKLSQAEIDRILGAAAEKILQLETENMPDLVEGSAQSLGAGLDKPTVRLEIAQLVHPENPNSPYVVIKTFLIPGGISDGERRSILKSAQEEIKLTFELSQNPDGLFVKVAGYKMKDGENKLVMPYYEGRTLTFLVNSNGLPNADQLRTFTQRIGTAISVMHQRRIYHRDVWGKNIFFAKEGDYDTAVLADMGTSNRVTSEFVGTAAYMDDLSLRNSENPAYRDMYAFSTTLYMLLSDGRLPYGEVHDRMWQHMRQLDEPGSTREFWSQELNLSLENLHPEFWETQVVRQILDVYLQSQREYVPIRTEQVGPSYADKVDRLNEVFARVFSQETEQQYANFAALRDAFLEALEDRDTESGGGASDKPTPDQGGGVLGKLFRGVFGGKKNA